MWRISGFGCEVPRPVMSQWKSAHAKERRIAISMTMDDSIERWTALVFEIMQGKMTVAEASRFDL